MQLLTKLDLCWVRAASGPFLEKKLFPLKVGLRWVFVNGLEWFKVDKEWVVGAKVGDNGSKPTSLSTLDPFWDSDKIHFNPVSKGGGNIFPKKALRQP